MSFLKWKAAGACGVLLLGVALSACTDGSGPSFDKNAAGTVKIMYYDENVFFQQYGNLFNSKFQNVDVQVASTQVMYNGGAGSDPEKALDEFIKKEQPDVLMLSVNQYKKMAEAGRLADLGQMLADKDFKAEDLYPGVIDLLKQNGGGKLYGLAPTFDGQAIYYNKDLFAKFGVTPPHDKMSWEQMLQLAAQFPADGGKDNRVYGYAQNFSDAFGFAWMIGRDLGLNVTDASGSKLTIDTASWKNVFRMTADALGSGAVYMPSPGSESMGYPNYFNSDPFVMGKAAMTVSSSYLSGKIGQAKEEVKDYKPFEWGLVTAPVDPNNPGNGSIDLYNIFCIRADSPNREAAWELVKFINGDLTAKLLSRLSYGNLQARTKYNKSKEGVSYEPFYSFQPKENFASTTMPSAFYQPFSQLAGQELQLVIDGKKSLDEAVKEMQLKGQPELDKAKQAQKVAEEKKASESGSSGTK